MKTFLQADGLIEFFDTGTLSVQYKTGPQANLYRQKELTDPLTKKKYTKHTYYKADDFQLLVVHDADDENIQYFIPAQVLIQRRLIGESRAVKYPHIDVSFHPQFLINFRSNNWKTKLMNIINGIKISCQVFPIK